MNIELNGDVFPRPKNKTKTQQTNKQNPAALGQSGGVWDYLSPSGPVCVYNPVKQLAVLPEMSEPEYQGEMELLLQLGIK